MNRPGYHFHPIPGKPPCPGCQQPEGVVLHIGYRGYSVTSGFEHKPECPALRCPHGVLWINECSTCEADRVEEGYDG